VGRREWGHLSTVNFKKKKKGEKCIRAVREVKSCVFTLAPALPYSQFSPLSHLNLLPPALPSPGLPLLRVHLRMFFCILHPRARAKQTVGADTYRRQQWGGDGGRDEGGGRKTRARGRSRGTRPRSD